jgi:aspartate-semialdehyde dehydrogenase
MLEIINEREIPVDSLRGFASERTAGNKLPWKDQEITIERLTGQVMQESYDYLLFSAGGLISKTYGEIARKAGNTIIDNSSQWRMKDGIPLVVPEVNAHLLKGYRGIVANPNCSTIQMVTALAPLHHAFGIRRIVVSTYQAVSGSGQKGIVELENQMKDPESIPRVYQKRIAGNCLPHIDVFDDSGFTREELKMVFETQKILDDSTIQINATTVRVPVLRCHSESITVTFSSKPNLAEVRERLIQAPGIQLTDDPANFEYPTPLSTAGSDDVYVGRIRRDLFDPHTISMWVVADNLRKGAATNAVQILEVMEKMKTD